MVFGLFGLFGGVVLSIVFTRPVGFFIGDLIGVEDMHVGKMLAFILIFLVCGISGMLGGWLARKMIETANLGFVDRLLGGLLGLFQGMVIITVIIIICYLLPMAQPWLAESTVGLTLVNTAVTGAKYLPEDWQEYLSPDRWVGQSRSQVLDVLTDPKAKKSKQEKTSDEDSE